MIIGKNLSMNILYSILVYLFYFLNITKTELLINVKNQGGDVLQESISANVLDDAVTLEFQRSDGTLITQLLDFRNEVQILKALVLGEEERGQSQYQVMCFVSHFHKNDFISSDAMAKLRQKNPGTIRVPEEDRGRSNVSLNLSVDLSKSAGISAHVAPLCAEASSSTYARDSDLALWAAHQGGSLNNLLAAVTPTPQAPRRCLETVDLWHPCTCHLETCIGWFPCGLKYCKGKPEVKPDAKNSGASAAAAAAAAAAAYRCGIKTCKKCTHFSYYVPQKQLCLWDE